MSTNEEKPKKLGGCTGKGFMPGKSGNPSGLPKGTVSLKAAVERVLCKEWDRKRKLKEVDRHAKIFLDSCAEGRIDGYKILFDRLDGPVSVDITSKGESIRPPEIVEVRIVTAKRDSDDA